MKTRILFLLLLLILVFSCSVKRNNPLDPLGNSDISVPQTVAGVICTPSPTGAANKYVEVRWDANSPLNTDGYYVYRGLAYGSGYSVVDTVFTNVCNHGAKPWHLVLPGVYWYKVSAFKNYDAGRLEGRLSEARHVTVPS